MRIFILLIMFCVPVVAQSQDKIILTSGKIIECNIIREDAINIYFTIIKNNQKISTYISKLEVMDIILHKEISPNSNSINNLQHNRISIFLGRSFPLGEFSDDVYDGDGVGLGGKGFNFSGTYSYYFNSIYGITGRVYYNSNEYKVEKIREFISMLSGYSVVNNSVNYTSGGFLAGVCAIHKVNKISFCVQALAGLSYLKEPETTFTMLYGVSKPSITKSELISNSIIYNPGVILFYSLNDQWDLFINADYMNGLFKFGKYTITERFGTSEEYYRGYQRFKVLNISAGISYNFPKILK